MGDRTIGDWAEVRAFILDVDGVLYMDNTPIPGAADAVAALRRMGYPVRFLTNVTMSSRAYRAAKLRRLGFEADESEILTASYLTARYLHHLGRPRTLLLLAGPGRDEFADIPLVEQEAQVVAVGDLGPEYSYAVLERAFLEIIAGARLVAMQKNRYWISGGRPSLDVGSWVAALEYATGRMATIVGKPSPEGYRLALESLGLPAGQVAMVSDDGEFDLAGARAVGLRTILVESGLLSVDYRPWITVPQGTDAADGSVVGLTGEPDLILPSIADLPAVLDGRIR